MQVTVLGTAGTLTGPLLMAPVSVEAGFPSPYVQVECLMRHSAGGTAG
jgi:hypothetical protein